MFKGREQEGRDHLSGMVSPSTLGGIWKEWKWSGVESLLGR